jgi:hypothetical protein
MTKKIEVFYTGGGITIVETDIGNNRYAVVSSDAPEFLTVYYYSDNEKTYLPDDMVFSNRKNELSLELQPLYFQMLDKLKTA